LENQPETCEPSQENLGGLLEKQIKRLQSFLNKKKEWTERSLSKAQRLMRCQAFIGLFFKLRLLPFHRQ